jgi:integrase
MKTPSKSDWPKKVKSGSVTVTVCKRLTASGNVGFQIIYYDAGKRKFESCSDETQAIKLAEKKAQILSTFGARVAGTSGDQMSEFVRVSDLLKPFSVTLGAAVDRVAGWLTKLGTLEAIDRALIAGPVQAGVIVKRTVPAAVTEMLIQKKSNGVSDMYYKDMKYRLENKFAVAFTCNVDTLTTSQLQTWLDGRKMPAQTYMNFYRLLNVFFEFCLARNYCAVNPLAKVESRKVRGGDIAIYSPVEMQKLLSKASDEFKPMLLFGGFAGLRTEEFKRMTWDAVDIVTGNIVIGKDRAKTGSRRVVPMSANLVAWLEPYKNKTGLVWTDGDIHHAQKRLGQLAGVPWKKNGLRHSFCTYRLAVTGDYARTAFEAGNTPKVIQGHYNALATPQSAREWFAIMPPATPATKPV